MEETSSGKEALSRPSWGFPHLGKRQGMRTRGAGRTLGGAGTPGYSFLQEINLVLCSIGL